MSCRRSPKTFKVFLLAGLIAIAPAVAAPNAQSVAALKRADLYIGKNNYRQAVEQLSQAIKADPQSAEAYCKRGTAYLILDDTDESMRDLDRAIKLNPKLAEAHFQKARVFGEVGQVEIAIKKSSEALALAGKTAPYIWYQDRAAWYMQLGQYQKALPEYDQALLLRPGDSWLLYFKAVALYKLSKYNDALGVLSKINKSQDADIMGRVLDMRARCYDKLGKPEQAKSTRKAAQSDAKKQFDGFDFDR